MLAFDIILEVISSMYLLEPFRPSEVGYFTSCASARAVVLLRAACYLHRGQTMPGGRGSEHVPKLPVRGEILTTSLFYQKQL